MKNDLDNIDLLVKQKLSNISFQVTDDEWSILNKKLSVKNFLKFSPFNVNIYYVVLVSALVSFTGYLAIQSYRFHTQNKYLEKSIKANNKIEKQSIQIEPVNNSLKKEITNKPCNVNKKDSHSSNTFQENKPKTDSLNKSKIILKDTVQVKTEPVIKKADSVLQNKPIKKKVYIKKNPVIIRDTIINYKTTH